MSFLELLKLASPEAVVVVTALVVLAISLTTGREAGARPATTEATSAICSAVAALGLALTVGAVLMLPHNATLFGGMLVITPLNSLLKSFALRSRFSLCSSRAATAGHAIRANISRCYSLQRSD